jgi:type II secretory pathway pseudopilin PulG
LPAGAVKSEPPGAREADALVLEELKQRLERVTRTVDRLTEERQQARVALERLQAQRDAAQRALEQLHRERRDVWGEAIGAAPAEEKAPSADGELGRPSRAPTFRPPPPEQPLALPELTNEWEKELSSSPGAALTPSAPPRELRTAITGPAPRGDAASRPEPPRAATDASAARPSPPRPASRPEQVRPSLGAYSLRGGEVGLESDDESS